MALQRKKTMEVILHLSICSHQYLNLYFKYLSFIISGHLAVRGELKGKIES